MPVLFVPPSSEQIARRFGDLLPSPEQIAAFEEVHGIGAYERCQGVEKQARKGKFKIGISGQIEIHHLERQGLPSALASAYVELLYGPPIRPGKLKGPNKRQGGRGN